MKLYERQYDDMAVVEDTHWWYAGLHALISTAARSAAKNGSLARILDAGCGTGKTMEMLHRALRGVTITGIDVNQIAVELTRRRNVGGVARASVECLPFADEQFDVLLCIDVLQMVGVDDRRSLSECHRVLKPEGWLLLNLPAFEVFRGEHDAAVLTARRYTRGRIRALLTDAGFSVELLTYWNAVLAPLLLIWRPLSRLLPRRRSARSDLTRLPGFMNRALISLILLDIRVAQVVYWPFGSSVFGIGRRLPLMAVAHKQSV